MKIGDNGLESARSLSSGPPWRRRSADLNGSKSAALPVLHSNVRQRGAVAPHHGLSWNLALDVGVRFPAAVLRLSK